MGRSLSKHRVSVRIDCKKAELNPKLFNGLCVSCGRPVMTTYGGKVRHRRGYKRQWDDPKEGS